MTPIEERFDKIFPPDYDREWYITILFNYPENEWFMPNNSKDDVYSICDQLAAVHLISKKMEPKWVNGSFQGMRVSFKYNSNLQLI